MEVEGVKILARAVPGADAKSLRDAAGMTGEPGRSRLLGELERRVGLTGSVIACFPLVCMWPRCLVVRAIRDLKRVCER